MMIIISDIQYPTTKDCLSYPNNAVSERMVVYVNKYRNVPLEYGKKWGVGLITVKFGMIAY